ncbi:DDB1- and CUL4-associated factor 13-like [Homarus americanus]|uniref:DDB1- and CUL4-associated factor 13-like n=1 Tax=Homarus americanus TaxID=6706 RepID=UPI001C487AC3|nr:DDB1- and CUL4-associated factor 13-like [Homarus americanus]
MSIKSIKVLSRNPDHHLRETKNDIHKIQRNYDPDLHPLEAVREYKLAMNAVKLERVFAKPFIGSLTHSEGVSAICRHPSRLSCVFTGTVEGELKLWNITNKKCEWTIQAHNGQIWSVEAAPDGASFFSVGNDKTIKRWSVQHAREENEDLPMDTWLCDSIITGITHHRHKNEFITCGERVLLWDSSTKAPKFSYDWSTSGDRNDASVVSVKFNPVETDLFASSDHANNIVLYDTRAKEVKKLKMTMRVNALAWNPMEAFILTAASEDYNLYSFDIRNMNKDNRVINIHEGHTSAVIDLDYAPTGREFCSGSYDRSLRIFRTDQGKSRDVYHTKRMFKVNCVLWSGDNKYILSGSSDHNVRVWKAVSHEKMGIMKSRERASVNYAEELKRKYGHFPEMRRILRHRHLPKHIYHARQEHRIMKDSLARKEDNRRRHSKRGAVPRVPARQKPVVGLQDDETSMPGPSFNDD